MILKHLNLSLNQYFDFYKIAFRKNVYFLLKIQTKFRWNCPYKYEM
jgi:hypothetical protein